MVDMTLQTWNAADEVAEKSSSSVLAKFQLQ